MTSSGSPGSSAAALSFGYDSDKIFKYREENMCDKWSIVAEQNNR